MNTLLTRHRTVLLLTIVCWCAVDVLAQWESVAGPYARNISAFISDAESPFRLYAGLQNGDLFCSTDDGTSWQKIATISRDRMINQLLQDPERPGMMYAATDAGFFISRDRGNRWDRVIIETGSTISAGVRTLAIDQWKPQILYAGLSGKGIFKSTNGGSTWSPANAEATGTLSTATAYDIKVDPKRPDIIYAAVSGLGVIKSTDGGLDWARLTEEFTPTSSRTTHIALHPQAEGTLVYGTDAGSIAKSEDGGRSWSPSRHHSEYDGILSLGGTPGAPRLLFAGTENGGLVSPDFGSTWDEIGGGLSHLPVTVSVSSSPSGHAIFAFGAAGLQRSTTNGTTWHTVNAAFGGAEVTLISVNKTGQQVYAVCNGALLAFDTRAGVWHPAAGGLSGGPVHSLTFGFESSTLLYATTPSGAFVTTNGGESWQATARTARMTPTFIATHPVIATRLYASSDQGLSVSTDRGNSWIQSKPLGGKYNVRSLTFIPTNAGRIFGATSNSAVITSSDGGFNWEPTRYGIHGSDICAVTVDDSDAQTCYAYTPSGDEFRSTNGGLEWNPFLPPWAQKDSVLLSYDCYEPSSVVALVNGIDIYYSQSGGGTWFKILQCALPGEALCLTWNASTATLFAGTRSNGVFRLPLGPALKDLFEEQ